MAHIASASGRPGSAEGRNPESVSTWRRKPWPGGSGPGAAETRGERGTGARCEGRGRRQQPAQPRGAFPTVWGGWRGGELRQGLRLLPIALSRERLRPPRRLLRRRIRSPPAPPPRIPPPAVPGAVAGTVGAELGSARRLGAADEERWRQRFPL